MSLQIKLMNSFVRLGVNRSHSRSYGEDLQRRMAGEGAISCERFGGAKYWLRLSRSGRLLFVASDPFCCIPDKVYS